VQQDVNQLGIPGVYLYKDQRRVYTHGSLVSHAMGLCGIDGNGLSGVEKYFDAEIRQKDAEIQLSLDLRIQHIIKEELSNSVEEFSAQGGNAIVMSVKTGEIISMVSLPDFDPNAPIVQNQNVMFNRNTLGAYEPGSTFKILNVSIALETGKATLQSIFDASRPVQIGRFQVTDFKGKNRPLTLQEAFVYSSNIASIKIAQQFGSKTQRAFLKQFGAFDKINLEIPELGSPLVPKNWAEVTTMTVAYGYGISVTPLQLAAMISSIVNDGHRVVPTLLKRDVSYDSMNNEQVVSQKTSRTVRELMRLVVTEGTAKSADIQGVNVIGKTGTAYQSKGRGYGGDNKSRTTTFIGAFPKDKPEYMLIVMLDNPQPTKKTYGYATAGWNAAPTAGRMINRIAPMLVIPTEGFNPDQPINQLINTNHIQQISLNDDAAPRNIEQN
jgi:cell division protein FtsI (penicillin-binding protein 3)